MLNVLWSNRYIERLTRNLVSLFFNSRQDFIYFFHFNSFQAIQLILEWIFQILSKKLYVKS